METSKETSSTKRVTYNPEDLYLHGEIEIKPLTLGEKIRYYTSVIESYIFLLLTLIEISCDVIIKKIRKGLSK